MERRNLQAIEGLYLTVRKIYQFNPVGKRSIYKILQPHSRLNFIIGLLCIIAAINIAYQELFNDILI